MDYSKALIKVARELKEFPIKTFEITFGEKDINLYFKIENIKDISNEKFDELKISLTKTAKDSIKKITEDIKKIKKFEGDVKIVEVRKPFVDKESANNFSIQVVVIMSISSKIKDLEGDMVELVLSYLHKNNFSSL